jgi:hypothetical protein
MPVISRDMVGFGLSRGGPLMTRHRRMRQTTIALAFTVAALACARVDPLDPAGGSGGARGAGTGATVGANPVPTGGVSGGRGAINPSTPGQTGVCVNLRCQQETCKQGNCKQSACADGTSTTVSGTVYDPAGKVPLYNVVVYVPNEPLAEITSGASCDTCASPVSGRPITAALSDASGHFVVPTAPVGVNIPLVMQIGKWRRAITIPNVAPCTDTPITDRNLTRLPRNQAEGHLPRIAIATGGSDALECLVRKIGVDTAEFTADSGAGRVHLYAGLAAPAMTNNGASLTPTATLWGRVDRLRAYDMLLMSCEGTDNSGAGAASVAMRQAMKDYADGGGRLFGSHWHNRWVFDGPAPWPTVAKASSGAHGFTTDITASIDTTFPKGAAFAEWMTNVGGSTVPGQVLIHGAEHSVDAAMGPMAQRWIYGTDATRNTPMVQYFTFNTPVEAAAPLQCGRVVMSDLHVSTGTPSDSGKVSFPTGCVTTDLTPQEKALEFMIFDLSSCVRSDDVPPEIPPIE